MNTSDSIHLNPGLVAKHILTLFLCFGLMITAYFGYWAIRYRQDAGAWKILDLRKSPVDSPRMVSFCAALADNPIGFPGHAYVVWTAGTRISIGRDYSLGFMPKFQYDQISSLITEVPGALLDHWQGNTRNLDMLTVILSEADFRRSKKLALQWPTKGFRAGRRDCVAFASYIARSLGLNCRQVTRQFPQDFILELKQSN